MLTKNKRWRLSAKSKFFLRSSFLTTVSASLILGSIVSFLDFKQPVSAATQANSEIFYKRSIDGGQTFGDFYNISNDAENSGISHVTAENGIVHILWDRDPQPREALYRRSADGGLSFETTFNVSSNNADSS